MKPYLFLLLVLLLGVEEFRVTLLERRVHDLDQLQIGDTKNVTDALTLIKGLSDRESKMLDTMGVQQSNTDGLVKVAKMHTSQIGQLADQVLILAGRPYVIEGSNK